jgi:hypothetical protein
MLEKYLKYIAVILFTLVVLTQIVLMNSDTRHLLQPSNESEGIPLEKNTYAYERGKLCLELIDGKPDEKIKIIINGEIYVSFTAKTIEFDVSENDIIEIDSSKVDETLTIGLNSCPDWMDTKSFDKNSKVFKERLILGRIQLK